MGTCNIIWKLEKDTQLKVIIFLWRWWSARNKANDGGRMLNADEINNSVNYFQMEFEKLSVGAKSNQLVNICCFVVRYDRMWPSTQ